MKLSPVERQLLDSLRYEENGVVTRLVDGLWVISGEEEPIAEETVLALAKRGILDVTKTRRGQAVEARLSTRQRVEELCETIRDEIFDATMYIDQDWGTVYHRLTSAYYLLGDARRLARREQQKQERAGKAGKAE